MSIHNDSSQTSSVSNIKKLYNRNSKGELNFPSLMKTNNRFDNYNVNNLYI